MNALIVAVTNKVPIGNEPMGKIHQTRKNMQPIQKCTLTLGCEDSVESRPGRNPWGRTRKWIYSHRVHFQRVTNPGL